MLDIGPGGLQPLAKALQSAPTASNRCHVSKLTSPAVSAAVFDKDSKHAATFSLVMEGASGEKLKLQDGRYRNALSR